jgi:hypothetical protein
MLAAECIPGSAVTVNAADDFYQFIDGWRGVIVARGQASLVCVECVNPDGQLVEFLIPPEQLQEVKSD